MGVGVVVMTTSVCLIKTTMMSSCGDILSIRLHLSPPALKLSLYIATIANVSRVERNQTCVPTTTYLHAHLHHRCRTLARARFARYA